jgi:C-terminal binding protein
MIYLTDYVADPDIERAILSDKLAVFSDGAVDRKSVEVLLIWHFAVDESVLLEYPNLKAVVRYGVGVDNVDLEACHKRGIKVFNNPDYGVDEVSDTAVAMIMALSRNIIAYDKVARNLVKQHNAKQPWQENTNSSSKRLSECVLGIVGVGRIGSAVARKMQPIVKDIEFYDPFVPAGYEKTLKAKRHETLPSLLANSDIVTVHVPLSNATKGIIDLLFVNQLKTGAILVNTARGGLIDDLDCFSEALASGKLSAVGLDVLPDEPPNYDGSQPFLNQWLLDKGTFDGRIIINPHTSYYSPQSYTEMREKAAKIALNAACGKQELNRIV